MSHKSEWLVATLAALTAALAIPVMGWVLGIAVFSLGGWLDRPCEIIGTEQLRSPDDKWNAIARAEACGGAIGTLTEYVYLLPAQAAGPPTPEQRVLEGDPVGIPRPIGLTWSAQDELTVTLPTGLNITKREHARDGVTFLYKPDELPASLGGR